MTGIFGEIDGPDFTWAGLTCPDCGAGMVYCGACDEGYCPECETVSYGLSQCPECLHEIATPVRSPTPIVEGAQECRMIR